MCYVLMYHVIVVTFLEFVELGSKMLLSKFHKSNALCDNCTLSQKSPWYKNILGKCHHNG